MSYDTSRLEYRAHGYMETGCRQRGWTPIYTGYVTEHEAHRVLDEWSRKGVITGGDVQRHIQGQGWVADNGGETDPDELGLTYHADD